MPSDPDPACCLEESQRQASRPWDPRSAGDILVAFHAAADIFVQERRSFKLALKDQREP